MKKLLLMVGLLVPLWTNAQPSPAPAATQEEVNAGTVPNKYVSPKTLGGYTLVTNVPDGTTIVSDENGVISVDAYGLYGASLVTNWNLGDVVIVGEDPEGVTNLQGSKTLTGLNITGTFAGLGSGLTDMQGSNVLAVARVIQVRDYTNLVVGTDWTLAVSNAVKIACGNIGMITPMPGAYTEVVFDAGLYELKAPIFINSSAVKLRGVGAVGQCVLTNGLSDMFIVTNAPGGQAPNYIDFENLWLRSAFMGGTENAWKGIVIACAPTADTFDFITIRDCRINGWGEGIHWESASNSRVLDSDVSFNSVGFRATNGLMHANKLLNLSSTGCKGPSLWLSDGRSWEVSWMDTGGIGPHGFGATNVVLIDGAASSGSMRGGNHEYYSTNTMDCAFIRFSGDGGHRWSFSDMYVGNNGGSESNVWTIELESNPTYAAYVAINNCSFGAANTNYPGWTTGKSGQAVKIPKSPTQKVVSLSGPQIIAGLYSSGTFVTNSVLGLSPLSTDADVSYKTQGGAENGRLAHEMVVGSGGPTWNIYIPTNSAGIGNWPIDLLMYGKDFLYGGLNKGARWSTANNIFLKRNALATDNWIQYEYNSSTLWTWGMKGATASGISSGSFVFLSEKDGGAASLMIQTNAIITMKSNVLVGGCINATNGFLVGAAVGMTTNINVIVAVGTGQTNQLQFTKGILTGVAPIP